LAVGILLGCLGSGSGATVVSGLTPMPLAVGRAGRHPFKLSRCGESSALDMYQLYLLRSHATSISKGIDRGAEAVKIQLELTGHSKPLSARDPTDIPRVHSLLQRTCDVSSCAFCELCVGKLRLC